MNDPGFNTHRLARVSAELLLEELGTCEEGLDAPVARARLEEYGPNRLESTRKVSPLSLFIDQFRNVLVLILLGGAAMALVVGHVTDAIAISAVVLLNSVLGFVQEWRAEQALAALRDMMPTLVVVRRNGELADVPAEELVPGDVISLRSGEQIPGDAILLDAHALRVDQSAMTGESVPVSKSSAPSEEDPDQEVHELPNVLLAGTSVASGSGIAVVVHTGGLTRMGELAKLVDESEATQTPLQRRLDTLGKQLAAVTVGVVLLVFGTSVLRGVTDWIEQLFVAVSLAVAGIPEGLPAVVTVTLALGMRRMAANRAIVRRLTAVETLGSTDVICTDKTGTLTRNRLEVRGITPPAGDEFTLSDSVSTVAERARRVAVLCNDADPEGEHADPMDLALLSELGTNSVIEIRTSLPRYEEVPFSTEWKFMATAHRRADEADLLCVKGAPDVLLDRCDAVATPDGDEALSESWRQSLEAQNIELAGRGLRVVGLAERNLEEPFDDTTASVRGLTWIGFVGFHDPPRDEVPDAVGRCRGAGIRVVMMTGDQAPTAEAIGRSLGFEGTAVHGKEIGALDDEALYSALQSTDIVARVLPEHKYRIVKTLQSAGHVVAVTGDGVNDAPALKTADIGVAMGNAGTEVARQAADVVLTDDNFATIVRAVHDGRGIYENVIRFLRYQLSTNVGALTAVFAAAALGMGNILNPIQLLWINSLMDGPPALLIATDAAGAGVMTQKPRPADEAILHPRLMASLAANGLLMAVGTLWVYWRWGEAEHPVANSMAFTTFVLFQVFNLLNVRSGEGLGLVQWRNLRTWVGVVPVVLIHALILYLPWARTLFRTEPLSLADWGVAALVSASIYVVGMFVRTIRARWH